MITKLMMAQRRSAYAQNLDNILFCLGQNPDAGVCDLGCDDGKWTPRLGETVGTKRLFGVELIEERRKQAEAKGINAKSANLNERLPFEDNCFDIIHANSSN